MQKDKDESISEGLEKGEITAKIQKLQQNINTLFARRYCCKMYWFNNI